MEVKNELGVIVEFVRQSTVYGFEVLSVNGDSYPDAVVQKDGIEYKAEFEFKSSNFNSHRHDIRDCDLIVCWENDTPDFPIPIITLSDSQWYTTPLTTSSADKKEAYYWKLRAHRAERRLSSLKEQVAEPKELKIRIYLPTGLSLSIEQRQELVKQMEMDELTNEQIAGLLGVSVGTVKNDKKAIRQQSATEEAFLNGSEQNGEDLF